MANPVASQSKRSWQIAAVVVAAGLAVFASVKISAGIQGSGRKAIVSIGTVTRGGNGIMVGDTTYATSGATFKIDGTPGTQTQLQNGDVVSLWGTTQGNQFAADEVLFNGNVRGAVSGIDPQSASFLVLQQRVLVNSETIFGDGTSAPASFADLQNGEVVEVSAFANATGDLVATRIEPKGSGTVSQVVGGVQALDSTRQTFRINSLTVDYSGAEVDGALAAGSMVVARGAQVAPDGTLLASQVEVLPAVGGQPGTDGRIDGVITSFSSNTYFAIDGHPVAVTPYTNLQIKQPLGLDVEVRVTGTFDANGVLVASKVKSYN
jgi:hypothetical protein